MKRQALPTGLVPVAKRMVDEIVRDVAKKYGVPVRGVWSDTRIRPLARARQEAYWRLQNELGLGYTRIGRLLNRDHTTVLYGIAAHQKRMEAGR